MAKTPEKSVIPDLFHGEQPTPSSIELEEWSGPVSPAHQFHTRIAVEAGPDGISLAIEDERGWQEGEFREVRRTKEPLPRDAYEALWSDLLDPDPFALEADLIGAEGRKRIGVAFNHLTLRLGPRTTRIDYRRRDLSRSKHAAQARLIERVLRLAPPR